MADKPEPQTFRLAIGQAKTVRVTADAPFSGGVAGVPMRFRMRDRKSNVLVELESGDGVTTVDAVDCVWDLLFTEGDTAGLKPGLAEWAFWRLDTGAESPVALGTCEVYRTAETG